MGITGDTSLYEFFGYFGLLCGSVPVLRVLVAVFRNGVDELSDGASLRTRIRPMRRGRLGKSRSRSARRR